MTYLGERWDFGFAEGADHLRLFKRDGNGYFAIETPYLNPREAGPVDTQKRRWVMRWLQLGKAYPQIRQAAEPPFTTQSFHECRDHSELIGKLKQGGWPVAQAFYVGDLCFVQQDVLGRWLAIKGETVLGILPLAHIIEREGANAAEQLLTDLQAEAVEAPAEQRARG
ncbi:MAG TPA: hypothetical protein VHC19_19975 [Pirellulales bacterium]|nr:hypothetical protein [Pirellulales bacterium]